MFTISGEAEKPRSPYGGTAGQEGSGRHEETRGRVGWRRIASHCVASRASNWHSRLNGNGRWFVRQSSFSGYARRSFSKQLQGEGERRWSARRGASRRSSDSSLLPECAPALSLSLYSRSSLSLFSFAVYSTYGRTRRTPPSHAKKASGIVFEIRFPR